MPTLTDIVFATAVAVAAICFFVLNGHQGLAIVACVAVGLKMIWDSLQVYRCWNGNKLSKTTGATPEGPDLPLTWHLLVLLIQGVAIVACIFGFELLFGSLLVGLYGGVYVLLHLRYYSGSARENAMTLLPAVTICLVVLATTVTCTAADAWVSYFGLGRLTAILVVLGTIPVGMFFGFFTLGCLGFASSSPDERLPITESK
mmetsp:Transcript_23741/g.54832  ORF Transcript_23741/g.54832 Transcript_23741/m.54832 type:complete len:202 (-) Transcript_23741:70-675(-)